MQNISTISKLTKLSILQLEFFNFTLYKNLGGFLYKRFRASANCGVHNYLCEGRYIFSLILFSGEVLIKNQVYWW